MEANNSKYILLIISFMALIKEQQLTKRITRSLYETESIEIVSSLNVEVDIKTSYL